MLMVFETEMLIVTSSALVGVALFDQLPLSLQLKSPAPPVQETAEGAKRLSSGSTLGCRKRGQFVENLREPLGDLLELLLRTARLNKLQILNIFSHSYP